MAINNMSFYGRTAVVWTDGKLPFTPEDMLKSKFFENILQSYLYHLIEHNSVLLDIFPKSMPQHQYEKSILHLLQLLNFKPVKEAVAANPEYAEMAKDTYLLNQFVEELYNHWRSFERYLVCYSEAEAEHDKRPYRTFNDTVEHMNHIFRRVYREICENITGDHPRIYRQLAAGFQVGVIAVKKKWPCPQDYSNVENIPFIRQALLYPPLIIDPLMNKRAGQFKRVFSNPLERINFSEREWMCYPAKVGDLLIHVYFHDKFISLGCSMSNLFELADDKDAARKPDAIYAFGVPENALDKFGENPTVFYDDEEEDMLVAAVPCKDDFGYFGYLKKMVLTLHNIAMMKRGRLPVHGAMVRIEMKNGKSANVIILGDTGAGKSESLEAFRILGEKHIRNMTIVFDDMGSMEITEDGIKAYGTEIGAFVRLDDLQPGFAFGNLDRSIIMSPQKINARAVIPVTTITTVLKGFVVDFFLYANNYEQVDDSHQFLEKFDRLEDAFKTFKDGAVMSKGTTTTTGLVHTYFANIFGPVQYKEMHEELAKRFFNKLFEEKVFVGQLRTRLGIPGFEAKGPEDAAKSLFAAITERNRQD